MKRRHSVLVARDDEFGQCGIVAQTFFPSTAGSLSESVVLVSGSPQIMQKYVVILISVGTFGSRPGHPHPGALAWLRGES